MKEESRNSAEPIAQNLIRTISNVCFSAFVFAVLIITVIAITYQPPDPWLQSAPALTTLFTQLENATFKDDSSVVRIGEDMIPAPATSTFINESVIVASETNLTVAPCPDAVNCSDPRLLIAVQRFNLRVFKSILFLEYRQSGVKTNREK